MVFRSVLGTRLIHFKVHLPCCLSLDIHGDHAIRNPSPFLQWTMGKCRRGLHQASPDHIILWDNFRVLIQKYLHPTGFRVSISYGIEA